MNSIESIQQSIKRTMTRLTVLVAVVVCGALAIAQSQRQTRVADQVAKDWTAERKEMAPQSLSDRSAMALTSASLVETEAEAAANAWADSQPSDRPSEIRRVQATEADLQGTSWANDQETPAAEPTADSAAPEYEETDPLAANRASFAPAERPRADHWSREAPPMMDPPDETPEQMQEQEDEEQSTDQPPGIGNVNTYREDSSPHEDEADLDSTDNTAWPPATNRGSFPEEAPDTAEAGAEPLPIPADEGDDTPADDGALESSSPLPNAMKRDNRLRHAERSFDPQAAEPPETTDTPAPVDPSTAEWDSQGNPPISPDGADGKGRPGGKELEGLRTPTISVQKMAPTDVQMGQETTLQVKIRNLGQIPVEKILVRDEVPAGTRLLRANPQGTLAADGGVLWELGTLEPGAEATVSMHIEPMAEGRIGSVAAVSFQTTASSSTMVTRPQLAIDQSGPQQVLLGELVKFAIRISNPGTGPATGVILEEEVPPGLAHTSGRQLEYEVGTVRPGETRHLELTLKAAQAGMVENLLIARADNNLRAQSSASLEIIAPQLRVNIDGPARRYLEREAVYTALMENPGTAPANNVELVVQLPRGLRFVNANNSGHYDSTRHAVLWNLASLPAKKRGRVQFSVVPTAAGSHAIRADAKAQMNLADSREHLLQVEGVPALYFGVADVSDPVEVGGQTAYEIRVVNQGSKTATNVRLAAEVQEGLKPERAEGQTAGQVQGQRIEFGPLEKLPPKGEAKYMVHVRGTRAGNWLFQVQLASDEMAGATKQESTHVYADE